MPYATQRDRTPAILEITKAAWPAPPLNVLLRSGFRPGVFDITWDDPSVLAINSRFRIHGVNLYRSFDSEFGPFHRVTEFPMGSMYWRDQTNNVLVEEDVSSRFTIFGTSGNGNDGARFVFKTLHSPIVKEGSQQISATSPFDVLVFVDGVPARVRSVSGTTGEVELDIRLTPEVGTQNYTPAVVPTPTSVVTCAYRYTKNLVRTDLGQRIFYRVTTVGIPIDTDLSTPQSQELIETPLEHASATNSFETEKLDYQWREAVRRNRWILDQGGERVLLFLQKNAGLQCPCTPDDYHHQPVNDCLICYGTGYVGGYEGPYEAIVAPDDGERRITQKEQGRTLEHTYEVWTGPTPILSQRDFLVKINGERYSIGAVRFPSNRGMVLQQHFNIGHIDDTDIRARVPVDNPIKYAAIQFAPSGAIGITNKPGIPQERQLRGRTKAWEDTEY